MDRDFKRFVIRVPEDEISQMMDNMRFDIHGFGYFLQQEDDLVSSFQIDDLEWIYYTQGEAVLSWDQHRCRVHPGDLILLEPGKTYSASCTGKEPLHYYYIHFSAEPDYLQETYMSSIFGHSSNRLIRSGSLPDFQPSFSALLKDRLRGEPGTKVLIHSLLVHMSVVLMRRLWSLQSEQEDIYPLAMPHTEDMRLCAQAVTIMRSNLQQNIRIDEICAQMGVSTSFLYKLFMRIFHQSPSRYMLEEKMKFVCHKIREEGVPIAAAAEQLGFSSASYLSQQFKKVYGITPSKWLKENR